MFVFLCVCVCIIDIMVKSTAVSALINYWIQLFLNLMVKKTVG